MPFFHRNRMDEETQNQNTIYKSLNTKDKSKKTKVKMQKAKDNKGKKPF